MRRGMGVSPFVLAVYQKKETARQHGAGAAQVEAAVHGAGLRVLAADAAGVPSGADGAGVQAVFHHAGIKAADAARGIAGGRHAGSVGAQADDAVVFAADAAGIGVCHHVAALHGAVFDDAVVLRADCAHVEGVGRGGVLDAYLFQPQVSDDPIQAEISYEARIGKGVAGRNGHAGNAVALSVEDAGIAACALTAADGRKHPSRRDDDILDKPGVEGLPARGGRLLRKPEQLPRVADFVHAVVGKRRGLVGQARAEAVLVVRQLLDFIEKMVYEKHAI